MKLTKNQLVSVFLGLGMGLAAANASAASLLDATMTTAVTDGFTNLQDTIKAIIAVAWPYIIGIAALLAAPSVVKRLISVAKS